MSLRDLIIYVVILEGLLHYIPWRKWLGQDLPRLVAYVLGMLGMMVPLSLWLMDHGHIEIMQTVWMVVASAGMTVFALYGLDRYLDLERNDADSKDIQTTMAKSMKGKVDGSTNQT